MYANDTAYTDQSMANVTAYLDGMLNGTTDGSGEEEPEIPIMQITDAKQQTNGMVGKTIVIDEKNNKIMVPKGFKIGCVCVDRFCSTRKSICVDTSRNIYKR